MHSEIISWSFIKVEIITSKRWTSYMEEHFLVENTSKGWVRMTMKKWFNLHKITRPGKCKLQWHTTINPSEWLRWECGATRKTATVWIEIEIGKTSWESCWQYFFIIIYFKLKSSCLMIKPFYFWLSTQHKCTLM